MHSRDSTDLPYWLKSLPREEWPENPYECPEYLKNLGDKDEEHLATKDEDFEPHTWEDVKLIVAENRLDDFRRVPSELRRYRVYTHEIAKKYGSVMSYMLKERLKWDDLTPKGQGMFEYPEDYKILTNDWPYGMDERIYHICVWMKVPMEVDARGDVTATTRAEIDKFVTKTFTEVSPDSIVWFHNWDSLKSIKSVEHFHVMLFDPDKAFIEKVTSGDEPQREAIIVN